MWLPPASPFEPAAKGIQRRVEKWVVLPMLTIAYGTATARCADQVPAHHPRAGTIAIEDREWRVSGR